ncbi:mucin-2-like [Perca fluviatilis]|uniref:mucin-2-like n=1 Tax=Perca fluviatilis TaxID=8168 RepID=UPI0019633978|nr:mucin-2-like [Perca fluviatilis]
MFQLHVNKIHFISVYLHSGNMCKLTLTAGLCLIIASLGYPGLTDTAAVPPNTCNGRISGLYPNPADPHSFYSCGNGIAYLQNCPSNLVFNPKCSCCDYPVTPSTTTTTPPTTTTTPPTTTTTTPPTTTTTAPTTTTTPPTTTKTPTPIDNFCNGKSNGQYTNPADPRSFYNCWDGRTYLQNCQSNLVFNQKCSCCDYPVTPSTTTTTPPTTTKTPTPIDNFCNGKSNGQYTNPSDPHSFYNCWDGRTYLQNCQSNLVFNQKCSCCDYPVTPSTTTTTAPTTTTTPPTKTTTPTPIDNFCNGKSNGQYTNPADPHSFYNCWDGRTYLQNCQSNLVFNQKCSCCDYPVTPSTTTTTAPTTTTTPPTKTKTPTPIDNFCNGKSNGQYTNPADPHSFYNCWDGRTYLQNCQSNLVFNQNAAAVTIL